MRSSKAFNNPEWEVFEKTRLGYRFDGYALLSGHGIEIGAMDHPANLPDHCEVGYVDALTPEQLRGLFRELGDAPFVEPDYLCDLDRDDLAALGEQGWDFVVLNHVIEHVANPLQVLVNVVRLLRPDGHLLISAPDKRFTFDRDRSLTSFEHLWNEYLNRVDQVSFPHYEDFITHVHPEIFQYPEPRRQQEIQKVIDRREHAHVWDSNSFREFLERGNEQLDLGLLPVFERLGETTEIEYFGVWQLNRIN